MEDQLMNDNRLKSNLSDLSPFYGEYEDLTRFLTEVEDIITPLEELELLERLIRFKQITQKIRGKAKRILQKKPVTWEQVKTLLIRDCSDRLELGEQIIRMETRKKEMLTAIPEVFTSSLPGSTHQYKWQHLNRRHSNPPRRRFPASQRIKPTHNREINNYRIHHYQPENYSQQTRQSNNESEPMEYENFSLDILKRIRKPKQKGI